MRCRCPHRAVARGRCLAGARLQADAAPCCRSMASVSRATSARPVAKHMPHASGRDAHNQPHLHSGIAWRERPVTLQGGDAVPHRPEARHMARYHWWFEPRSTP
ncbi:hypothetical protein ADT26_09260 [Xanthomonas oryzae]|nr:hypothetical protein ADT26_09260 [Xanthomonas oryzae]